MAFRITTRPTRGSQSPQLAARRIETLRLTQPLNSKRFQSRYPNSVYLKFLFPLFINPLIPNQSHLSLSVRSSIRGSVRYASVWRSDFKQASAVANSREREKEKEREREIMAEPGDSVHPLKIRTNVEVLKLTEASRWLSMIRGRGCGRRGVAAAVVRRVLYFDRVYLRLHVAEVMQYGRWNQTHISGYGSSHVSYVIRFSSSSSSSSSPF